MCPQVGDLITSPLENISEIPDSRLSSSNDIRNVVMVHDSNLPNAIAKELSDSGSNKHGEIDEGNMALVESNVSDSSISSGSEKRVGSDSVIRRCNSKILAWKGESTAQKIWGICKRLGASYSWEDQMTTNFVEELESRDRNEKALSDEKGDQ